MTERNAIIAAHRQRTQARKAFMADFDDAEKELHPKVQADRLVSRQKAALRDTGNRVSKVAQQNVGIIVIAGIAVFLFAARRPIASLIERLNADKPTDSQDKDEL